MDKTATVIATIVRAGNQAKEQVFDQFDEAYRRQELLPRFKEYFEKHREHGEECLVKVTAELLLAAHVSALNARDPLMLILTQQGMCALTNSYIDELIDCLTAFNNRKMAEMKTREIDDLYDELVADEKMSARVFKDGKVS